MNKGLSLSILRIPLEGNYPHLCIEDTNVKNKERLMGNKQKLLITDKGIYLNKTITEILHKNTNHSLALSVGNLTTFINNDTLLLKHKEITDLISKINGDNPTEKLTINKTENLTKNVRINGTVSIVRNDILV